VAEVIGGLLAADKNSYIRRGFVPEADPSARKTCSANLAYSSEPIGGFQAPAIAFRAADPKLPSGGAVRSCGAADHSRRPRGRVVPTDDRFKITRGRVARLYGFER
jgi:hypothetical protein